MFTEVWLPGEETETVTVPDNPINLSTTSTEATMSAPAPDADTERLLVEELGYDVERVVKLRKQGVV